MSQEDFQTKVIEGVEYKSFMLPPMKSQALLVQVSKMIGPSIGPVLDKLAGKTSVSDMLDQTVTADFFAKAAEAFFRDIDSDKLESVQMALMDKCHADNQPLSNIYNVVFLGRLDLMYRWMAFAMQAQWGKLSSALVPMIVAQGAAVLQPTKSR